MTEEIAEMQLSTDRLVIRPYVIGDVQEAWELMQDPELFTYLHMEAMSLDEYQELFQWLIDSYDTPYDEDFKYSFAVTLKESGDMVGWCGVGRLDLNPSDKEIYYLIGRRYWGNGYASEAVTALIDYCFNVIRLPRIVAKVDPKNVASKTILEKNGFTFEHILTGLTEEFSDCNGELYYSLIP
jgi:[ribosomal protein S5]-alanine N-acetyltransferase